MNYPAWDVPHIGSMWVIGGIAIVHILISHFAIGGGFYLPIAERKALAEGRLDWFETLRRHSKFFLILTGVYGAGTGVGIWFAIGLANAEATSTLIHNFVFGWAIEWVFFMVELTSAAVYYYTWDKIPQKLHLRVGWVYAGASLFTLIIINGILTFMLTPGQAWLGVAGTGQEASKFWQAFFNPTYWPSLFLRMMVCTSMAGIFALFTCSRINGFTQPKLKTDMIRWSTKWLFPSFILMPILFVWYLWMVPDSQKDLLQLGVSTIGQGTFTMVTRVALITIMTSATILAIVYFMAYRNPLDFGQGHALAIIVLALAATGSTEQAREMLRKPFVIVQHMYSNSIRISQVQGFNERGYLARSPWVRPEERARWASAGSTGSSNGPDAAPPDVSLLKQARIEQGKLIFQGQCLACHTRDGYRSMKALLQERDRHAIENIITMLHKNIKDSPYKAFMPPVVGTAEEMDALIEYLDTIRPAPQPPVEEIKPALGQAAPAPKKP